MRTVALSEAKDRLSALIDEVSTTHEIVQVTKHGHPSAVIMSADDLEALPETLDVLSTPGAVETSPRHGRTTPPAGPSAVLMCAAGTPWRPEPVWEVRLSRGAVNALDRLPEKVAVAVAEFVTGTLPTDPYRMSKPLHEEGVGDRLGDDVRGLGPARPVEVRGPLREGRDVGPHPGDVVRGGRLVVLGRAHARILTGGPRGCQAGTKGGGSGG